MRKKTTQIIEPGNADVGAALLSGDAFFRLSQEFVLEISPNFQIAGQHAASRIGELQASATNLALAIEIYLKALLLLSGMPAPKTHELPDLYSKLPTHVRHKVEESYEHMQSAVKEGQTAALSVHITQPNATMPNFNKSPKGQDHSVKGVLLRSANAFVTWRYLFAHSVTKDGYPITYEFLRLVFVAKAVRQQFGELSVRVGV